MNCLNQATFWWRGRSTWSNIPHGAFSRLDWHLQATPKSCENLSSSNACYDTLFYLIFESFQKSKYMLSLCSFFSLDTWESTYLWRHTRYLCLSYAQFQHTVIWYLNSSPKWAIGCGALLEIAKDGFTVIRNYRQVKTTPCTTGPPTGVCVLLLLSIVISSQISVRSLLSADYFYLCLGKSIPVCHPILHAIKVLTVVAPLALVPESSLYRTCIAPSMSMDLTEDNWLISSSLSDEYFC